MTYEGIAKGRTIELAASLPYPDGQRLRISVEPAHEEHSTDSPQRIREAMRAPPHLDDADVDALEAAIEAGMIPVSQNGVFDAGHRR